MDRVHVIELARRWFSLLNNHAPVDEVVALLNPDGVEMIFPEATLNGEAQFRSWYQAVTHKFFDQEHNIRQIDVTPGEGTVEVFVIVNWKARTWEAPAAFSSRIDCDAYQNWQVRELGDGRLVISRYEVAGMTQNG